MGLGGGRDGEFYLYVKELLVHDSTLKKYSPISLHLIQSYSTQKMGMSQIQPHFLTAFFSFLLGHLLLYWPHGIRVEDEWSNLNKFLQSQTKRTISNAKTSSVVSQ